MGMSSSSNTSGNNTLSEINVTPLVDVMLVLLIIFMVTAPLIQQGVEVDLPETKAQIIDSKEQKVILTIDKNRNIFIGKTKIPFDKLAKKIKYNEKLKRDKEIYLHADQTLQYGYIVEIMAILKNAGLEEVGMITDPPEVER